MFDSALKSPGPPCGSGQVVLTHDAALAQGSCAQMKHNFGSQPSGKY